MSALRDKWAALPRAAKWLAFLALFVGVYFLALGPMLAHAQKLESRAGRLEAALHQNRNLSDADSTDGKDLDAVESALGRPLWPGTSKLKAEGFSRIVNGILEGHEVFGNVTERRVQFSGSADAFGTAIDRLILEVTFEARPEVVVAILADLEKAPEVAAVSRVRIDRGRDEEAQTVRATIAPEAWIPSSTRSIQPDTEGAFQ